VTAICTRPALSAGIADHFHIELEADDKQHERDPQLVEQADLVDRLHDVERRRARDLLGV
jgi:hypothetical protein